MGAIRVLAIKTIRIARLVFITLIVGVPLASGFPSRAKKVVAVVLASALLRRGATRRDPQVDRRKVE